MTTRRMGRAPRQVTYTKVSETRERVWLEGRRLAASGFERGVRYRLEVNPERGYARFLLDPSGDRVVSGRANRRAGRDTPIIDVCLAEIAPPGTRVRAVMSDGVIEVTLHHEEIALADRERRLRASLARGRISEASVCTGIGVSTAAIAEGVRAAGLRGEVEWVVEMDGRYTEVADRNNSAITERTRIFNGKLEEIEPELVTPVDLLSFSLPCDGHSLAGKAKRGIKRAESHDLSATSVFGLVRILDAANPSALLSENVVQARDSATYELLRRELERRNYLVQDIELDSTQAGTIDVRRRWFFVAISKNLAEGFDINRVAPSERVYARVKDLLEPIGAEDDAWRHFDGLREKAARDKDAGKNFRNFVYTGEEDWVASLRKYYNKAGSTDARVSELAIMSDADLAALGGAVRARESGADADAALALIERMREADNRALSRDEIDALMALPSVRERVRERLFTPVEHARLKGIPEALVDDVAATIAHEGLGQSGLWGHFAGLAQVLGEHLGSLVVCADGGVIQGDFSPQAKRLAKRRIVSDEPAASAQGELFSGHGL
ncbi:DNA (cytosine-5)-methyltransferase 1 [Natronocella acetinitrilica]|uniref:DNA (cytosine-5-)-methyltransferase n=1 Tax=Natronocella acetinitrilica TaxID=414046 RepID=A0AAE3KBB1_9GAMM|nr:DNA cytosine methyltransferase [Natronocella acetinitrilica]MCP1674599.1 DNA (cytosine-5)-methyltransferase 1 [Natronocella acetinitrilica]